MTAKAAPTDLDRKVDAALESVELMLDLVGERVGVSRRTLIRELRRRERDRSEGGTSVSRETLR